MSLEDAIFRSFVIWRIFPVVLVLGTIWYYKRKGVTLKSMKLRLTAFFIAKFMARFNKRPDILKMKDKLFTGLADQKTNIRKKLQILEIGAGGGANFTFYPSGSQIVCLDPNPNFESYLVESLQSVETSGVEMKSFIKGFAERMDTIEDNSLDAVVCSMVLCSVKDLNKALEEIKRVLKPVSKIECLYYKGITGNPQPHGLESLSEVTRPIYPIFHRGHVAYMYIPYIIGYIGRLTSMKAIPCAHNLSCSYYPPSQRSNS